MARRRTTVKRIDPWSVLKFAVIINLALLAVGLLVAVIIWMIIERLQLVEQVCSIMLDVGFTACGVNAGNLFRALILLGLLWVVVQTAVMVFLAFLYNLIADLTGGLTFGVVEDVPKAARKTSPGKAKAGAAARREAEPPAGLGWAARRDTAAGPPVRPLGADDDQPGSWTDGYVIDEGAAPAEHRTSNDPDDDLFGPR